jgi:glutamate---cysteine ligase / carboxylate-amine ligase
MSLPFNGSPAPSVGIEIELFIVDRRTGELVDVAPKVLELTRQDQWLRDRVKPELFQHTLEVITGKCDSIPQAIEEQRRTIESLRRLLGPNLTLISAGTHPFSMPLDHAISEDAEHRYANFVAEFGINVREMASAGTHVHVGVPSGDAAIRATDVGAMFAPLFISLSASSPFSKGVDSGLQSGRKAVFESLSRAELPPALGSWREYEREYDELVADGMINSPRDLWWHDRPNPKLGTSESRASDAMPTLREVGAIAALKQCLVAPLSDPTLEDPLNVRGGQFRQLRFIERDNMDKAARYGLDARFRLPDKTVVSARDWARETADMLRPIAEKLGCEQELAGVRDILEWGNSARRQRAILAAGGSRRDIVNALAAELENDAFVIPLATPAASEVVQAGAAMSAALPGGVRTRTVRLSQPVLELH